MASILKAAGGPLLRFAAASTHRLGLRRQFGLQVATWQISPPGWPPQCRVRAVLLSDLHACEPWMPVQQIQGIVAAANALRPDIVLLLGDYVRGIPAGRLTRDIPPDAWAAALAGLTAPLGVHAILGNHDWLEDEDVQRRGAGPTAAGIALAQAGIPVLHNSACFVRHQDGGFWLAGLGSQDAFHRPKGSRHWRGVDDLGATLAAVTGEEPILLMAHEPDIFPVVPDRVSLTLSGHTHGGQVRIGGRALVVPSRYGTRYAYGHIVEGGRHLLVSSGLGFSDAPVRFGVVPEIVCLELGGLA